MQKKVKQHTEKASIIGNVHKSMHRNTKKMQLKKKTLVKTPKRNMH